MQDSHQLLRNAAPMWLKRASPYGMYRTLSRALCGCRTILDLGCGPGSLIEHFAGSAFLVGMDRYFPALEENRCRGMYHARVQGDLQDLPFAEKSVDAVVSLDVIEHLEKDQGRQLLSTMEAIAVQRVVVLTPNGFVPQSADANSWQLHRSGWDYDDFARLGYKVYGIYGAKWLRGEYARLRLRPWLFWEAVSFLSYPITYRAPRFAFALCAVKWMNGRHPSS